MRLVREFADRPGQDGTAHSRPLPVLLFTGPRGSGKTAFLAALEQRLDQQVPYARIDCDELGPIRATLSAIAYELNRNSSGHDRIAFPDSSPGRSSPNRTSTAPIPRSRGCKPSKRWPNTAAATGC
ncbi:ATP-binding protein [Saccharopolyspora gloriosae]|uniref:ATP-binding protein n=1 Tax=Saccharopolyspora gloriosae TaxID=455344 RepID=UPI001FB63A6A|nr:ATP-binding protein [Saccharopolyspora gloriosae]